MKIIAIITLLFVGCRTAPKPVAPEPSPAVDTTTRNALTVAPAAFDGSSEKFQTHENYLAMSLPYGPYAALLTQIEQREVGSKIQNRGEAHLTVLSPPEFTLMKSRLSMSDINSAADKIGIQTTEIQPVCVGEGKAKIDGIDQRTYFVVVRAQNLVRIRREIQRMFVSYGGDKTKFNADHFYPHVTLGFTKTDLFEEQGVVKDENSCKYSLVVMGAHP